MHDAQVVRFHPDHSMHALDPRPAVVTMCEHTLLTSAAEAWVGDTHSSWDPSSSLSDKARYSKSQGYAWYGYAGLEDLFRREPQLVEVVPMPRRRLGAWAQQMAMIPAVSRHAWALWLDCDTSIWDTSFQLRSLIDRMAAAGAFLLCAHDGAHEHKSHELVKFGGPPKAPALRHLPSGVALNSGVFLLRGGNVSREFLRLALDPDYEAPAFSWIYGQGTMTVLLALRPEWRAQALTFPMWRSLNETARSGTGTTRLQCTMCHHGYPHPLHRHSCFVFHPFRDYGYNSSRCSKATATTMLAQAVAHSLARSAQSKYGHPNLAEAISRCC